MTTAQNPSSRNLLPGPFRSLSSRLLLALLAIHLVLAPLLVIFVLKIAEQNYKDRFIDQARSDAQWIQSLLETPPTGMNRQVLLNDLVLTSFRQSIQLFDTNNNRLYAAGTVPDSSADTQREDFGFGQHEDQLYRITLPLQNANSEIIQTVRLAYDESPIAGDISKLYNHSLELAALYLALIIAAVAGFSRYLAHSLKYLSVAAHRIATGRYQERFLPRNCATEIIALSDDLEHMRKELVERGQKLEEQSIYLRTLLDQIAEGVVTFDANGAIETSNPAALKIFSCNSGMPNGIMITDWLPDLLIPAAPDTYNFPTAQPYLGQTRDGGFITVELTVRPVKHLDQNKYLVLIRDISEKERIENERRKHHNELAHARRLSSLGEMAAGLAHELNQPLAAINLYIQGCLKRLGNDSACSPDIKTAIEKASLQAQRAGDIISQIRSFVKKAPLQPRATDINSLIKETVLLVETEAVSSAVDIGMELEDKLPTLDVDPLQIQQVLINLVSNSLDALNGVNGREKQLLIRTQGTDTSIEIAVEDSGRGISKDITDQLFTPFTSDTVAGLGLGLAISHSITKEHNGDISFRNRMGGGTVFTLTLPIAQGKNPCKKR